MSFDEPRRRRPERRATSVESFSVDASAGLVLRRVERRGGSSAVSSVVDLARGTRRPRDRFDVSWLRAATPPPAATREPVAIVDLFAGCGGFSLGGAEACRALGRRAEHVFAVEFDENAAAVFAKNFPECDLRDLPIEEVVDGEIGEDASSRERKLRTGLGDIDLLTAGPPCQGHSDLNNHSRRNDPKNALYLRALRFAEITRPRHIVIENVPGVAHDRLGVVWRSADLLARIGYSVETAVLNADHFGVPQRRRRHVLVASRDIEFPIDDLRRLQAPARRVTWAIEDLGVSARGDVFDTPARHAAVNERRIKYLFDHGLYELPDAQRPDCHRLKPHSYRAVYGRMHPDRPAPTITAGFGSTGQGRFVHPFEPRTLTPHEAARVQGFPDYFDFSACRGRRALQQMIGNAVPPRLAYALAVTLLR
jgi:DNA (cytosine-5)-methyltransferase 1